MQESPIYPQEGTAGSVASRYRSVRKTDAPPSLGKIPTTTIWWPFTLGASAPGRDLSRRNAGHITTCSHGLQSSISDRTLKYRSRAIQYNGKIQQEAAGHPHHKGHQDNDTFSEMDCRKRCVSLCGCVVKHHLPIGKSKFSTWLTGSRENRYIT